MSDDSPIISSGSDYVKLTLNFHQRQMLNFLAKRGGRTKYTFDTPPMYRPDRTESQLQEANEIARAADKSFLEMSRPPLNLITLTPIIGQSKTFEALMTDVGRQVFEQMVEQKPITQTFNLKDILK